MMCDVVRLNDPYPAEIERAVRNAARSCDCALRI